jgi:1-deoxy-D-xylulose-5-phosphate reductoisomerase
VFRNLNLAFLAMDMEGTAACALNAANEITVQAFLDKKIGFLDIAMINEKTMLGVEHISKPKYEDYVFVDGAARKFAEQLIIDN